MWAYMPHPVSVDQKTAFESQFSLPLRGAQRMDLAVKRGAFTLSPGKSPKEDLLSQGHPVIE